MNTDSSESANPYEDRPLAPRLRFLIVDDHPDGRFLVAKTLLRKYPTATIVECSTGDEAFRVLKKIAPTLIIAHRTVDFDGISLVKELRSRAPSTLLMMSSGIDRREAALAVGADAFLTYEEWLTVGNRVAELLASRFPRIEA